ncbi:MAG: NAD(P)H-binding protein [Pseudonocardiales bacterium]
MTRTTLVTGGTGTLGRAVRRQLAAAGHDVRVLSRGGRPVALTAPYTTAIGDLRTGAGIASGVAGADVIIHCATTNKKADVEMTQTLIDAAHRAGTGHLIYISIVGVDVVPLGYYRAKLEVEQLLATSGLPWTVLRATQFHDLVTKLFAAQRWLPMVMAPRGISIQPIDVRDVAQRLVELAGGPPAGRVPDIGGPQVRPATDLAHAYLSATKRRRLVVPVPLAGKTARAYRAGGHLTPEHAVGTITFEQFVERVQ